MPASIRVATLAHLLFALIVTSIGCDVVGGYGAKIDSLVPSHGKAEMSVPETKVVMEVRKELVAAGEAAVPSLVVAAKGHKNSMIRGKCLGILGEICKQENCSPETRKKVLQTTTDVLKSKPPFEVMPGCIGAMLVLADFPETANEAKGSVSMLDQNFENPSDTISQGNMKIETLSNWKTYALADLQSLRSKAGSLPPSLSVPATSNGAVRPPPPPGIPSGL